MIEYKLIVYGRVQGVGYRFFVQSFAEEMGIFGWVKNLSNDNVEILCQNDDELVLMKFFEILEKGPTMSRVDRIKKEKSDRIFECFSNFEIR